jgi:hypothetical protein
MFYGSPPVQFRVRPTYIYERPEDNFIAGRHLIAQFLSGRWTKAETWRLGYENSEDALSWNVFRSLQEAGQLKIAVGALTGLSVTTAPRLYLWGHEIRADAVSAWPELDKLRQRIEPGLTQQTEPDICMHVAEWGWLFTEAKLSSATSTYRKSPERLARWVKRYAPRDSPLFDADAIQTAAANEFFPEQLLRNVAYADAIRDPGESAVVIALVRAADSTPVESRADSCLKESAAVRVRRATWESLQTALDGAPERNALRHYMHEKTLCLQRAFA